MPEMHIGDRIDRVKTELRQKGLDAYIVSTEENIWYLTNLVYKPEERPFFIVVPVDGRPTLVVPALEERHLGTLPVDCLVVAYPEFPSQAGAGWADALQSTVGAARSVGIEGKMKAYVSAELRGLSLVVDDIVEGLRLEKSAYEIGMIRKSAGIASSAMERLLKGLYKGASVVESFMASKPVQTALIKSGEFNPLSTYLLTAAWPSPSSSMPHSVPGLDERYGAGPNVAMCYFRINGYAAECERTFFLEPPSAEDRERFGDMTEARRRAFATLRPGVLCSEIDEAANGFLRAKGYGGNILHRTGHGIGLGNHEEPWLARGDDRPLRENMVVSIEPGIYFDADGGYRHSDTVLITNDGYEILTDFPVSLEESIVHGRLVSRIKGRIVRSALGLS